MTQEKEEAIEELLTEMELSFEDLIPVVDDETERRKLLAIYRDVLIVLFERRQRMEKEE